MNWPGIVASLTTTLVTAAAFALLLRSGNRPPKMLADAVEIGPSTGVRIFCVLGSLLLLGAVGALVYLLISGEARAETQRLAWFIVPMFLLMGIPLLLEARVRLWMDGDGIRGRTAYRGRREIRWSELTNVTYSTVSSCIVLRAKGGERIWVSRLHKGHNYVFDVLMDKAPQKIWRNALNTYIQRHGARIKKNLTYGARYNSYVSRVLGRVLLLR